MFLLLFVSLGLKNATEKQEILRRKQVINRRKNMNIQLKRQEVNKIWNTITNENLGTNAV
jgi:hypothetical protein